MRCSKCIFLRREEKNITLFLDFFENVKIALNCHKIFDIIQMPSTLYRIPFDLFVKVKAQSGFEVIRWNSRTLLVISGFPGINGFVSLVRHKIHSIKKWKKTCYKGPDNIGFSLIFFSIFKQHTRVRLFTFKQRARRS